MLALVFKTSYIDLIRFMCYNMRKTREDKAMGKQVLWINDLAGYEKYQRSHGCCERSDSD